MKRKRKENIVELLIGAAERTREVPTCSIPRLLTEYTCIKCYNESRADYDTCLFKF